MVKFQLIKEKNNFKDSTLNKEFALQPVLQIDQFLMDNQDQLGFLPT